MTMSKNGPTVDLRSDTVTRPTDAMRKAMAEAEVGDDVYGEDPTVNRLQEKTAELFEREAALFVPTGSMGNLICMRVHGGHGGEVLCDSRGHILNFEIGSVASIAGVIPRAVDTPDGHLTWDLIEPALPPRVYYRAQPRIVALENTQNLAGGTVMAEGVQETVCKQAHERGLNVHLDGARIFNASVATGKTVAELSRGVDSIMFSLSKGLGAPVGAVILSSKEFIEEARIFRKMFGGGMRQAGILAAAGLVALERNIELLERDHIHARELAEGLAGISGIEIDLQSVQTNILVFDVSGAGVPASQLTAQLEQRGVRAGSMDDRTMRMVTHYDVDEKGIKQAIRAMGEAVEAARVA